MIVFVMICGPVVGLMCDAKKEFQCTQTKYCIPKEWHCDGEPDCSDTSDEYNCNGKPSDSS